MWTTTLVDGQITAEGPYTDSGTSSWTYAVTGGTGIYENVRGSMEETVERRGRVRARVQPDPIDCSMRGRSPGAAVLAAGLGGRRVPALAAPSREPRGSRARGRSSRSRPGGSPRPGRTPGRRRISVAIGRGNVSCARSRDASAAASCSVVAGEDHAAVLIADVGTLAVHLCRVVHRPEHLEQLVERHELDRRTSPGRPRRDRSCASTPPGTSDPA